MENQKKRGVSGDGRVIAANLRTLREYAGLSQHDVAVVLAVSHQQVQKYEGGINRFPLQSLPALCDAFGVPMEAFLQGVTREITPDSADFQQLQRSFGRISNPGLRRKILQVVDILAA